MLSPQPTKTARVGSSPDVAAHRTTAFPGENHTENWLRYRPPARRGIAARTKKQYGEMRYGRRRYRMVPLNPTFFMRVQTLFAVPLGTRPQLAEIAVTNKAKKNAAIPPQARILTTPSVLSGNFILGFPEKDNTGSLHFVGPTKVSDSSLSPSLPSGRRPRLKKKNQNMEMKTEYGSEAADSHLHFYNRERHPQDLSSMSCTRTARRKAAPCCTFLSTTPRPRCPFEETAARAALVVLVERAQTRGSITKGHNTKQRKNNN